MSVHFRFDDGGEAIAFAIVGKDEEYVKDVQTNAYDD